jgi:two-component system cell cycle sensor histidine kinase/response regulator CckA
LNLCAPSEDASQKKNAADLPGFTSVSAFEGFIAASADTQQWVGKETILLAEDEALVRNATGEALESAGYTVVLAASAAQALEAHRNCGEQVDLLLSDLVMPGISGHELANELLVLCPNVRVLFMSGYAEQLALCQLSYCGRKYLAKPFSIPALLRSVREVLDNCPRGYGPS